MSTPDSSSPGARHVALALLALAVGAFTIGTTEFVTMGVLPQIAGGLDVSEPEAAHGISAYALGVVVGVPLLSIMAAHLPRRPMLLALMAAYALFNVVTALAPSIHVLIAARFLDGLPHGAYFGFASLVAASLVSPRRRGRAIAAVMLGLSIANIAGVPVATWLGQNVGWRATFTVSAVLACVTVLLVALWVPQVASGSPGGGRAEARTFFRSGPVWLTLAAGSIGLAGTFAIYSYISTTITSVAHLPASAVPIFLLVFGVGMALGTWAGGELAAWSVPRSLLASSAGAVVAMSLFWVAAPHGWWLAPAMLLLAAVGGVLVTALQLRLMDVAGDAVTLGAAMNHAALNIGNALGAWAGGAAIAAGLGYRSPALLAAAFAAIGFILLLVSVVPARRSRRAGRSGAPRPR